MNLQRFYTGEAFDAYEYFGAHPLLRQAVEHL